MSFAKLWNMLKHRNLALFANLQHNLHEYNECKETDQASIQSNLLYYCFQNMNIEFKN